MCKAARQYVLLSECVISLLLFMIFSLPTFCASNSNKNPSFKYSREANKYVEDTYGENERRVELHDTYVVRDHAIDGNNSEKNIYQAGMKEIWLYSMGSTLFISAVPFFLLFVIPLDNSEEMRPRLKVLLAFASGGLLGDAFLHLIPHAINPHHDHSDENYHHHSHGNSHSHYRDHSKDTAVGLWVLGGIIAFLTVEKLVRLLKGEEKFSHGHSHATFKKTPQSTNKKIKGGKTTTETISISGYLNLAADFTHNFTDGLAIGASFLAGKSIGVVTTITILLHEVPHEIGDFAILIKSGCSRRKAILLQLLTGFGALIGNGLTLLGVGANVNAAVWVLPFTAGGFIYIATVNVLPELLEESTKLRQSIKEICALLTGVFLMVLITHFE